MKIGRATLVLAAFGTAAGAQAPPAAPTNAELLACALGALPPSYGEEFVDRYVATGPDGDFDDLLGELQLEAVAHACVDPASPYADQTSKRLGEGFAAFQLIRGAQAALTARPEIGLESLKAAWHALGPQQRAVLTATFSGKSGEAAGEVVLAMLGSLGLSAETVAAEPRLAADLGIYAVTRAMLESRGIGR